MSHKNFPPEIIEAILRLLPVKSLGRFKCVSKTWNSLISDPHFVKNHVRQTRNLKKLILLNNESSLYCISTDEFLPYLNRDDIPSTAKELSFGSPPKRWQKDIIGSCNGLVLYTDVDYKVFVMNPSTRELWKLPRNPFDTSSLKGGQNYKRFGFGYDSSTDDYKIVKISVCISNGGFDSFSTNVVVSTYSLRNNSWRKLLNAPHDNPPNYGGAFINPNYHWLAESSILAFSFVDEVFIDIKLPDSFPYWRIGFYDGVLEFGGKLGAFWGGSGDRRYELWVMQEYGDANSWTRVYSHEYAAEPVCMVEGSDRNIVLISDKDELLAFNIDEGRCRNISVAGGPSQFVIGGTFVENIESLARIIAAPL